jgi:hypothetical protein
VTSVTQFPERQTFAFVAASAVCSAMFRITLSLTLSNKQQQLHLLSHLKHYQTAFPSHLSFAIREIRVAVAAFTMPAEPSKPTGT